MLTQEELEAIRKRAEEATEGNPLKDTYVLARMDRVILEDVPKLLAEIDRLHGEISFILNVDMTNAYDAEHVAIGGDSE